MRARLPALGAAVTVVAAAMLSACTTVGPDYKRPDVPLPAAWRSAMPDAADVADTDWWDAFGDADLSALVREGIASNKDLLIASHRIEELEARLAVSQSAALPQVGFNSVRERVWRSEEQPALLAIGRNPDFNNVAIAASVRWEIDIWGRVARSNEAARAELLGSEEARRAVMLKVVTGVATAYLQLLAQDRQLALVRLTLANRSDSLALVDMRYKGGSSTLLDVARARAAVDDVQALLPALEREIAFTENALAALIGRNPGPVRRQGIDAIRLPPVPQGLPSDLLNRRPDVVAAEQALVAANARIGIAKLQYFPTISLTGVLGLASDQLRWLLARTARDGEIAAGLAGTLFDGGRIEGDIRAAQAVQRRMAQTYLQAVQTSLREVDDALVARSKAAAQVAALDRLVATLQDVSRLARLRFEGGQATTLDVLEADRQVIAAQDRQAQLWREQTGAVVAVYKAMGGGWMLQQDKTTAPAAQPPAAVGAAGAAAQQAANTVGENGIAR